MCPAGREEGAETTNDNYMSRLRVLLLGPDCHPERVSIPRVTYCHAAALAELHDVTLVARSSVEHDLRRANAPFSAIEVVHTPLLDRISSWVFRRILKSNPESQARTALGYPFHLAFEWRAWRQLRRRIFAGDFDVVLRLVSDGWEGTGRQATFAPAQMTTVQRWVRVVGE